MTGVRSSRWLMSFADLTLLLLAFFVLLHARADGRAAAASVRAAFGGPIAAETTLDLDANALFEPREAVLRPGAVALLRRFGARAAGTHARVHLDALGSSPATSRLDGWEISAARAAAVARAIGAGGLDPRAIDISLPQGDARSGRPRFTLRAL